MKITKLIAKNLAKKYKINLDVVDFNEFHFGLNVELEHGKKISKITNIINDNIDLVCRIVIAHLIEFPDYYKYLKKMEIKAEKYWKKHNKPNIFIE